MKTATASAAKCPCDYWVLITTRNRHSELRRTLDSLLNQTVPPKQIMIFDDGSTPKVELDDAHMVLLRREDEGYDIRRVVKNWNACLNLARTEHLPDATQFTMISADDCLYPTDYAERILHRMTRNSVAVASGSRGLAAAWNGWKPPEGAGRFISNRFLQEVDWRIPERAGYEPWIFYEALRRGYQVACYDDGRYEHLEKLGGHHRFTEWGHMERVLGYDDAYFLGRILTNMMRGELPKKTLVRMVWNYATHSLTARNDPFYENFPEDFRAFVRRFQRKRIRQLLRRSLQF